MYEYVWNSCPCQVNSKDPLEGYLNLSMNTSNGGKYTAYANAIEKSIAVLENRCRFKIKGL